MDERDVLDEAEVACLDLVRSWRDQVNTTAGQTISPRVLEVMIQEFEQFKHAINARQIELSAQVRDHAHAGREGQGCPRRWPSGTPVTGSRWPGADTR